jgi:hypothetical protein
MGSWNGVLTWASNGHSQRSGKQRLQRRAAMIRRHEAAGAAVALDQTAHHHMLSRGLRDAGRLPVGVGGEAEKQEALRDSQGTGDGCGGGFGTDCQRGRLKPSKQWRSCAQLVAILDKREQAVGALATATAALAVGAKAVLAGNLAGQLPSADVEGRPSPRPRIARPLY